MTRASWRSTLRRARSMPVNEILRRALARGGRALRSASERRRDLRRSTYAPAAEVAGPLGRILRIEADDIPSELRAHLGPLTHLYLDHRFDLLGSGWTRVAHGIACRGLEGIRFEPGPAVTADPDGAWLADRVSDACLEEARRIWRCIDRDASASYSPIDWQLDFKSGYRWSARTWHGDIRRHRPRGQDLKVPWELARMQHLPQLALARGLAARGELDGLDPVRCDHEIRSQILDFVATNPPRFGVNWTCAMDVGIRVANWLVARDLLLAGGGELDELFESILARSVLDHGRYILEHLEGEEGNRANHYLANLAGLVFCAAYLPRSAETDAWLAFGTQELVAQTGVQFHADGSNFEGSTSYHRLSAEMVAWSTALLCALQDENTAFEDYDSRQHRVAPRLQPGPLPRYPRPGAVGGTSLFPAWYWERLARMADFTRDLTRPDGRVAQIGDNDSGRFLILHPLVVLRSADEARRRHANLEGYAELDDTAVYPDAELLDHRPSVGAINGLLGREDLESFCGECRLESRIVARLVSGRRAQLRVETPTSAGSRDAFDAARRRFEGVDPGRRQRIEVPAPGPSLRDGLAVAVYPDFGVAVFRSRRIFLAVRCEARREPRTSAHVHADQLAIELCLDGRDVVRDPGSYLYAPIPERRIEYRSVRAHFAPRVAGREPIPIDEAIFRLGSCAQGECLYAGDAGFCGRHTGYGTPLVRVVEILPDAVRIEDFLEPEGALGAAARLDPLSLDLRDAPPYSAGYGVRAADDGASAAEEHDARHST